MGKTSRAVTKNCVPLHQLRERDIREGLGGCSGHRAMIRPLSNKGTYIKLRKGKSSRLFRFESNITANELWLDV